MKRIHDYLLPLVLLLALVLAACAPEAENSPPVPETGGTPVTPGATTPGSGEPLPLEGTSWVLVSYGMPGEETPVVGDQDVTLRFGEDGTASGSATCNTFNGPYTVGGTGLTFGPLASTKMACADADSNAQEVAYLTALQSATAYQRSGDLLMISYGDGNVLNFAQAVE